MNDPQIRTAGELQRAARRHARLQSRDLPRLIPLLVLGGDESILPAEHLSDRPGLLGDPDFVLAAYIAEGDMPLWQRVEALLSQALMHRAARPWRWPARPGLVIVTDEASLDGVKGGMPSCVAGTVLAVYSVGTSSVTCMNWAGRLETVRSHNVQTPVQACAAIRRDIVQALLREAPTPWGQVLHPRVTTP